MLDFLTDGPDPPGGLFSAPVDTLTVKASSPFSPGMTQAELEEATRKARSDREKAEKIKFAEESIALANVSIAPPWKSFLGPKHPPSSRDKALAERILQMAKESDMDEGNSSAVGEITKFLKLVGQTAANTVQLESFGSGGAARSVDEYERRKFDATIDMFKVVWQTPLSKLTRISFSASEVPSLFVTVMGRFRAEFQFYDDFALEAFRSSLALSVGSDMSLYERVEWEGEYLSEEDSVRKKLEARRKREEEDAVRLKEKRKREDEERRRREEEEADGDDDEDDDE
eukprot:GDKJ01020699.1.p1 GENE.GDKJ01020699.1~~GDKJ01020699.1.p1  ORF type:complete len:286 (-),score=81.97 GDKJ01020699.1:80-937(-)